MNKYLELNFPNGNILINITEVSMVSFITDKIFIYFNNERILDFVCSKELYKEIVGKITGNQKGKNSYEIKSKLS